MTISAFLAATDLDALQQCRSNLGDGDRQSPVLGSVITDWTDRQAVANLLMFPELIPADLRIEALLRALAPHGDGYLRVAATVGLGDLEAGELTSAARADLVQLLLNLIAEDSGPAAVRAAAELGSLLQPLQAPELAVLLRHAVSAVRHNVTCALVLLLGGNSIADFLGDRDSVTASDAAAATEALTSDGVDIHRAASDLRMLPVLPHLPDLADW